MSQITGKITKRLNVETGEGRNGTWEKVTFVITTNDQYPKDVAFEAWNDKVQEVNKLQKGQLVTVHYDPQSREYNEKWYTSLRVWKIEAGTQSPPPQQETKIEPLDENEADNLPF